MMNYDPDSDPDSNWGEISPRVCALLGTDTVEAFLLLPQAQRQEVLRRSQVQQEPVIFDSEDDDSLNSGIANGIILRMELKMGTSGAARQCIREAQELYYGENHFIVPLHLLHLFMVDRLQSEDMEVDVGPMVRRITVEVDLHDGNNAHYIYTEGSKHSPTSSSERRGQGGLAEWTQERLQQLLGFRYSTKVVVKLRGGGMLDGSDLATHQTIRNIAVAVKVLMVQFGDELDVVKEVLRENRPYKAQSIRSYWEAPTRAVKERVRDGTGTFEDIVQVEIEEWTLMVPANNSKKIPKRDVLI